MTIYRLIAAGSFGPEEIKAMTEAYEVAFDILRLNDPDDPITELIAKSIVAIAAFGERDPAVIADRALNALGISRPDAA